MPLPRRALVAVSTVSRKRDDDALVGLSAVSLPIIVVPVAHCRRTSVQA